VSLKLQARRRVGTGKGAGRRIRNLGLVPAVLYGNGKDAVNLAVAPRDVKALLDSEMGANVLFELDVNGGETVGLAMIQSFQKHPVKRTLVHCDLLRLDPAEVRTFKLPIALDGESPAGRAGARVRFVTRHIRVRCLPGALPDALHVDVSEVAIGGEIRLGDVVAPSGVELVYSDNAPVFAASANIQEDEEDEDGEEEAEEEAGT